MKRRTFVKAVVAGGAAVAAGCEEGPPPEPGSAPTDVVHIDALAGGAAVDFTYAERAAFAVRLESGAAGGVGADARVVAFLRACPHMGCRIDDVDAERGTFGPCRCHQSLFDLHRGGAQIYGRATQRLVQLRLEVLDDGTVCAVGLEGVPYGEPPTVVLDT